MKKTLIPMLVLALLLTAAGSAMADVRYKPDNGAAFRELLSSLATAYESPTAENAALVAEKLEALEGPDRELAESIADHWKQVYMDPDYRLYLFSEGKAAKIPDLPQGRSHALVVLGYELRNGKMQDELKGRCQAAAALAQAYPDAVLVCSGGATGENNPERHTEAGLMKQYLSKNCGIEADRIYVDTRARTTAENAVNTLKILQRTGVTSMTLVTSSYHQRWAQVLYHALAEVYRMETGYDVALVSNFCFEIETDNEKFRKDDRIAIHQLGQILKLPQE